VVVVKTDILAVAVFIRCTSFSTGDAGNTGIVEAIISRSAVVVDFAARWVGGTKAVVAVVSRATVCISGTDVVVVKTDVLAVAILIRGAT
jgi:hypothetical protein